MLDGVDQPALKHVDSIRENVVAQLGDIAGTLTTMVKTRKITFHDFDAPVADAPVAEPVADGATA